MEKYRNEALQGVNANDGENSDIYYIRDLIEINETVKEGLREGLAILNDICLEKLETDKVLAGLAEVILSIKGQYDALQSPFDLIITSLNNEISFTFASHPDTVLPFINAINEYNILLEKMINTLTDLTTHMKQGEEDA